MGYSSKVCDERTVHSFYDELTSAIKETKEHIQQNGYLRVKLVLYTDNIMIIGDYPMDNSVYSAVPFLTTIMATCYIQKILLVKYKILTRGAIAIGKLSYESDLLYGPLMVMLNSLEKEAKYPRVLVHSSISDFIEKSNPCDELEILCNFHHLFFKDQLGQKCLNYMGFTMSSDVPGTDYIYPTFSDVLNHKIIIIDSINEHYKNKGKMKSQDWEKIMEKYLWVIQYHNNFCNLYDIDDYKIDTNQHPYCDMSDGSSISFMKDFIPSTK